jgi:hypothetical protein
MMKTLRDYLTESEQWADTPREGDDLDIEVAPDELVEAQVVESDGRRIVLAISESAFDAMDQRGMLSERIARYGPVGSSRATGFSLAEGVMAEIDLDLRQIAQNQDPGELIGALQGDMGPKTAEYLKHMMDEIETEMERRGQNFQNDVYRNLDILMDRIVELYAGDEEVNEQQAVEEDFMDRMLELAGYKKVEEDQPVTTYNNAAHTDPLAAKAADLAPVGTMKDPTTAATIDEGMMSEIDIDLQSLANRGDEEDLIAALEGELGPGTADVLKNMMEELKDELASKGMNDVMNDDDKMIEMLWDKIVDEYGGRDLDEAEYQGRKVPLGKPMRGDVKKFKVYVKDPKTGNVKKVNFGHGGKSAKRAGEKTLSIKKSDPARRRSFRARHRCDTAKDRTTARYWSCRMW